MVFELLNRTFMPLGLWFGVHEHRFSISAVAIESGDSQTAMRTAPPLMRIASNCFPTDPLPDQKTHN